MSPTVSGAARSKTIWLGFAIALLGYLQANITTLAPWIDQKWIGLGNVVLGLAVMIVRFYTDRALGEK